MPAGYQLCDGTNGTPDLRDKFVMGAGPVNDVDSTGGAANHAHANGGEIGVSGSGTPKAWLAQASASASSYPPFHALAYIQRMT